MIKTLIIKNTKERLEIDVGSIVWLAKNTVIYKGEQMKFYQSKKKVFYYYLYELPGRLGNEIGEDTINGKIIGKYDTFSSAQMVALKIEKQSIAEDKKVVTKNKRKDTKEFIKKQLHLFIIDRDGD